MQNEKIEFCFKLFDLNKSGSLTFDEMELLISTTVRSIEVLGAIHRVVTVEEMGSVVAQAFAKADGDGGGSITLQEFNKWAKK